MLEIRPPTDPTTPLFARLQALRTTLPATQRGIIALAGVPGAGKTTLTQALADRCVAEGVQDVAFLPMDGFHFSKAVLATFPDPSEAARRRGAPHTFDVEAFLALVTALHDTPVIPAPSSTTPSTPTPTPALSAPSFSHSTADPVANAIPLPASIKIVVIEGNYTLLDEGRWAEIAKLAHEKWFIDAAPEAVRERLVARHLAAGIERDRESAVRRVEGNDAPNGVLIRERLVAPDVVVFQ